jgi:hypothetical protein
MTLPAGTISDPFSLRKMKTSIAPEPIDGSLKTYYLSNARSVTVGVILILIGLSLTLIPIDWNGSVWSNFQMIFLDFSDAANFVGSLLLLPFKVGFITIGIYFLQNSSKIVRAKIDSKGFYYKEAPTGRLGGLTLDLFSLQFLPFANIKEVTYKSNRWIGDKIELTSTAGSVNLISLQPLKAMEKKEIVAILQAKINKTV